MLRRPPQVPIRHVLHSNGLGAALRAGRDVGLVSMAPPWLHVPLPPLGQASILPRAAHPTLQPRRVTHPRHPHCTTQAVCLYPVTETHLAAAQGCREAVPQAAGGGSTGAALRGTGLHNVLVKVDLQYAVPAECVQCNRELAVRVGSAGAGSGRGGQGCRMRVFAQLLCGCCSAKRWR